MTGTAAGSSTVSGIANLSSTNIRSSVALELGKSRLTLDYWRADRTIGKGGAEIHELTTSGPAEFSDSHRGDWKRQGGGSSEKLNEAIELLRRVSASDNFQESGVVWRGQLRQTKQFVRERSFAKLMYRKKKTDSAAPHSGEQT
jgi:hypothetical protein